MRFLVFILCLMIVICLGCSGESTTYPHITVKKMPVSLIVPTSAQWLKESGYKLRSDSLLIPSIYPAKWGKSFFSIDAYMPESDVLAWMHEGLYNGTNHIELAFYPREDSVEIALSIHDKMNNSQTEHFQSQLNDLAKKLHKQVSTK